MEYQVELKQIVRFPRCRIYRDFIRSLTSDKSIRTNGSSYLFHYIALSSYANYQTSYQTFDGVRYLIQPGEWICRRAELPGYLRVKTQVGAIRILNELQDRHLIQYTVLGRGKLIKYSITDWSRCNKIIEENAPCQKDMGFFFFPVSKVHELVSVSRCSEMDCILDLWIHAVYNDVQVQGSELGPVVYFRGNNGNPLTSYADMAGRWGLSKASVCRLLKKLECLGYVRLITFPGRHGTAIYLCNYLSTMFGISDVSIYKEEVSVALNLHVSTGKDCNEQEPVPENVRVSNEDLSVSKSDLFIILKKVAKTLQLQGFSCASCPHAHYILSNLFGCKEGLNVSITCPQSQSVEHFTLYVRKEESEPDEIAVQVHSNNRRQK